MLSYGGLLMKLKQVELLLLLKELLEQDTELKWRDIIEKCKVLAKELGEKKLLKNLREFKRIGGTKNNGDYMYHLPFTLLLEDYEKLLDKVGVFDINYLMDNFNSKELLDIYWTCGDLQELIGANREEMEKLYGIIIESYGLKEKEKIKVIKQLLNKSK